MTTTSVLTPVARLVQGNLYNGSTTSMDGKPLVTQAGEARSEWYFAIAIKKNGEVHWNQTPWGAQIWQVGCEAFKNAPSLPSFAWKITDGDSSLPNKNGVKPCDKQGFAGHWVLHLSCGFAPKIYNRDGSQPMPQADAINPGDYIQVLINVAGNNSSQSPGVYLNHNLVAFQGYGDRITMSVDPRTVGFGQAELPAGVSATPLGGLAAPSQTTTPFNAPPVVNPQVPSQPHTAILNAPLPPAAPPAKPAKIMTPKAGGATYESFIAINWTDAQLIAEGYMIA